MAFLGGFSIAVVSNALSFEFMQQAASVAVPGHAPMDAHDLHIALTSVVKDLQGQHPGRLGKRVYMGYSLGAMVAPLFVTSTALTLGLGGWAILGGVFLASGLGTWAIARVAARSADRSSTPAA